MRRLTLPLLLLALLPSPALPARKKESPAATLQRRLNGVWGRNQEKLRFRIEIRRNATTGGVIRFMFEESYLGKRSWRTYETAPYRVAGPDRIRLTNSGFVYQIKFTRTGMEWTMPGVKGSPLVWRRLHRLPGDAKKPPRPTR